MLCNLKVVCRNTSISITAKKVIKNGALGYLYGGGGVLSLLHNQCTVG